jgi:hypothetical protein
MKKRYIALLMASCLLFAVSAFFVFSGSDFALLTSVAGFLLIIVSLVKIAE